jgi:fructosamine-3-kinase
MTSSHELLESIRKGVSNALGETMEIQWVRELAGGDINQAALVRSGKTRWFVKYHAHAPEDMFTAEAHALAEIAAQDVIKVPSPIAQGRIGETSWLVLEYLELTLMGSAALMGEQLAALHGVIRENHGWTRDNYIGTTIQTNTSHTDWATFWSQCRLQPQLTLAECAGFGSQLLNRGERLLASMSQLLQGHQPAASLLHGDLWTGNKAFTVNGQPVIFDPASYYGDRETDIAMTELFGGFEVDFYAAYRAHSPLPAGYGLRRDLYNLYHMLNHLNLFGGGYLSRCEHMMDRLLAEIH